MHAPVLEFMARAQFGSLDSGGVMFENLYEVRPNGIPFPNIQQKCEFKAFEICMKIERNAKGRRRKMDTIREQAEQRSKECTHCFVIPIQSMRVHPRKVNLCAQNPNFWNLNFDYYFTTFLL